jgi:Ca2+-transporting ATPase
MDRPPREPTRSLFSRHLLGLSVIQGLVSLTAVVAVYLWATAAGLTDGGVRALSFTTLMLANLALIFVNRSWTGPILRSARRHGPTNRPLWWVVLGTLLTLGLLLSFPATRALFQVELVSPAKLALAAAAGMSSVLWFELYKLVHRRRRRKG